MQNYSSITLHNLSLIASSSACILVIKITFFPFKLVSYSLVVTIGYKFFNLVISYAKLFKLE